MGLDLQEIEEELQELESRIDRLRALYEQYFMGIEKLEPHIPRKDVERRIHTLRKEKLRNTGQRFRFQMLAQRYNTMQQYWGRVVREIENGTYRRGVARGAQRSGAAAPVTMLAKRRQERYAALETAQAERERARRGVAPEPVAPEPVAPEPVAPEPVAPAPLPPPRPPPASPGLGLFFRAAAGPPKPSTTHAQPAAPSLPRPSALDGARRAAALAAGLKGQRTSRQTEPTTSGRDHEPGGAPPASSRSIAPPAAHAASSSLRSPLLRAAAPAPPPSRAGAPAPPSRAGAPAPPSRAGAPAPPSRAGAPALPSRAGAPAPPAAAVRPPGPASAPSSAAASGHQRSLPEQRVRQIYNEYVEARRASNESTAGLTYDKLARTLQAQTEKFRVSHATKKVDFEVEIKNGRTVLKPVLK